jgi:hypothetical protein
MEAHRHQDLRSKRNVYAPLAVERGSARRAADAPSSAQRFAMVLAIDTLYTDA